MRLNNHSLLKTLIKENGWYSMAGYWKFRYIFHAGINRDKIEYILHATQVPMGILDKCENLTKDMIDILEEEYSRYIPKKNAGGSEKVRFIITVSMLF